MSIDYELLDNVYYTDTEGRRHLSQIRDIGYLRTHTVAQILGDAFYHPHFLKKLQYRARITGDNGARPGAN